ncbi:TetR family transcriptional regulator [Mycobacterium sp.]|jgi:AcrR family transcriptional regulator|uniref:TetR/AcrR family transcriptional regulator n=1 Tax=Mycobacterium sp. TaxID=1785 RepID=UPI002D57B597|nr:TetR family transcriptional regulator [Mycobacterium sp.]HZA10703.1 TetR family transcriptional regulator [Mycobacterium sp.]
MAFTERSAATRDAILSAARKLFGEQGYDATTIRAVAAEVGVDPSMVMRYYGNKAGLFEAAVDVDLYLEKVSATPRNRLGEALARHFLSRWEGELSDEATTLLLRSAATNADAAERMRTVFDSQVTKVLRDHVGGADAPMRAALLSSQLLGLALTRYVVKLPPVAAMDTATLVVAVAPVLQYYLTADLGSTVRKR